MGGREQALSVVQFTDGLRFEISLFANAMETNDCMNIDKVLGKL